MRKRIELIEETKGIAGKGRKWGVLVPILFLT